MRLVICGAGVVIGLVMVVAGVRLWLGSSPAGDTGPTFATSALIFLCAGVIMIALSSRLFLDTRRQQLLSVTPLTLRNPYPP